MRRRQAAQVQVQAGGGGRGEGRREGRRREGGRGEGRREGRRESCAVAARWKQGCADAVGTVLSRAAYGDSIRATTKHLHFPQPRATRPPAHLNPRTPGSSPTSLLLLPRNPSSCRTPRPLAAPQTRITC